MKQTLGEHDKPGAVPLDHGGRGSIYPGVVTYLLTYLLMSPVLGQEASKPDVLIVHYGLFVLSFIHVQSQNYASDKKRKCFLNCLF